MKKIIYVYDPMCSWCYGFRQTWQAIQAGMPEGVQIETRLGGLAPDDQQPMPDAMRDKLASTWHRIEELCQVPFDHSYWKQQPNPPRTTYIAGRAVRAAQSLGGDEMQMVRAIQDAYYQQGQNVWRAEVLIQLAEDLGLDRTKFSLALDSNAIRQAHEREVNATYAMGVQGYPSLVWQDGEQRGLLPIDYANPQTVLDVVNQLLSN